MKSQLKTLKKRQNCAERNWHLKKKLLYFFHVIYVFKKAALKTKLLCLHHNDFFASHFKFKKNSCFNIKKILLIQNDKRYKKVRKELRYVSTHENVTSLFLRRTFVAIHINAIVNENFNKFHNWTFFKLLWRRHLWRDFDNNRSFFENDALHIRQVNVIN